MTTTMTVPWAHPSTGEVYAVRCAVSGRYVPAGFEAAAEHPEVDLVEVVDGQGVKQPAVLEWLCADADERGDVEDAALEAAAPDSDEGDELDLDECPDLLSEVE